MSFLDVSRIYGHHTLQICIWFPLELVRALDWLQGNVVRLRLCTDFPEMSYPRESWQLVCENRISLSLSHMEEGSESPLKSYHHYIGRTED